MVRPRKGSHSAGLIICLEGSGGSGTEEAPLTVSGAPFLGPSHLPFVRDKRVPRERVTGYCSVTFGEADNVVDIQGVQKCPNKAGVGRRCYVDTLIFEMYVTI